MKNCHKLILINIMVRVLLENTIIAYLDEKFLIFYGSRRFITVFIRPFHSPLSLVHTLDMYLTYLPYLKRRWSIFIPLQIFLNTSTNFNSWNSVPWHHLLAIWWRHECHLSGSTCTIYSILSILDCTNRMDDENYSRQFLQWPTSAVVTKFSL
jgi:hypothetical protein